MRAAPHTEHGAGTTMSDAAMHGASDGDQAALHAVETIRKSVASRRVIHRDFALLVHEMEAYLRALAEQLEAGAAEANDLIWDERERFLRTFRERVAEQVRGDMDKLNTRLNALMSEVSADEFSSHMDLVQRTVAPFFLKSNIGQRALAKPLGYAGDYEMMNQVYRNGFEGDGLLGEILHWCVVNEPSARSVRYRRTLFRENYESLLRQRAESCREFRSLSVACGPAVELQDVVASAPPRLLSRAEFNLLDLDERALNHARSRIQRISTERNVAVKLNCVRLSVKTIALNASIADQLGQFDLIYSAGLYDYLDVRLGKLLTRRLCSCLKPGGRLIVGNFAPHNPSRAFCDLVVDWPLIYKSEEEMRSMAPEGSAAVVKQDPIGVNYFLVIEK